MNSMSRTSTVEAKPALEKELQKLRQQSLIATRAGDFRKVAELTRAASRLNEVLRIREE
jgi:hypothetical protein